MSAITENPRGGCVLAGINSNLSAIGGVCPVFHSGPGCCLQTSASEQGQSGGKNAGFVSGSSIPCSNMLEKEVVFGGTNKLRTTVQGAVDIIDAKTFFILTGCTAGIIGDDVESIAQEFRDKGHEVYAIETPGFHGDSNLGYEVVWNTFIDQVIEPAERDEKLVNIFGIVPYHDPYWYGNLEEIRRILERLGLKVNTFYTNHQTIDDVKKSSGAALNIVINPWLFEKPAEKYKEKFGVPWIKYPGLPVGATDTTEFVRQVAEALSLDKELVEKVIWEEEDYVYSFLEQAIGRLSWKRFCVIGDANSAIGITRYLANDYSFTPKFTIVSETIYRGHDVQLIKDRITQLEYAKAPEVVFAADQYRINETIYKHDDVSLIVGSANDREAASYKDVQFFEATFPVTTRLFFNRAIAGYRGSLTLTEDLYDNI